MADGCSVSVDLYKDIDWSNYRPLRGGIIPYMMVQYPYFIMCIDKEHNEIASFSGGIKYVNSNEDAPTGALRELKEEGLGVFGNISIEQIPEDAPVIYNEEMMIILLRVVVEDFESLRKLFSERYLKCINMYTVETRDIINISGDDFLKIVRDDSSFYVDEIEMKMYFYLRDFLAANLSFLEML